MFNLCDLGELESDFELTDETKKKVEDFLNEVVYGEDPDYIPSDFALEFINFIKLVNGGKGEENLTPVIHYRMLDNIQKNDKDTLNMCHRGIAKSTVLGTYLILYIAVYSEIPGFGKVPYALYVSDSIENGVKKMRKDLEYRWENSEFLQTYVPTVKLTDIRWEFRNADNVAFVVSGFGAKTGVRGTRELGTRPVLAILDDLISDDDARSSTVIASVEDTVYKAVDYALHPQRRKIIWSGTPFNARDPLYKAVESGAWHVNVYPICEKFPCTRAEFKGSWEDRFSYDYVKKQYIKAFKSGKIHTFNQELMLRIMSEEDRLITDLDINWYKRKTLLMNRSAYNFYATTDFATSERAASDFSVISVWALNWQGYWFWVDGICKKQDMGENIKDLFRLVQKWRPQSVGVEVSGQQGGFIPWIQQKMTDNNCYFNFATENNDKKPGIRPNTDKMVRFNIVVPWFKAGMMFFPLEMEHTPEMRECMEELKLVSPGGFKAKQDDFIDTISMLGSMQTIRPAEEIPMEQDADNIWGIATEENSLSGLESYVV
jgi:predicted phage terminase large subunit-like protein